MANDIVLVTGGRWVPVAELDQLLGWTLRAEGLCRSDTCVPVPDRTAIERGGRVDLVAVAGLLDRPAVADDDAGVTAVGAPRERRRRALDDLVAPDFVLPDVDGTPHALSDHRSKKRLLVAFSSW